MTILNRIRMFCDSCLAVVNVHKASADSRNASSLQDIVAIEKGDKPLNWQPVNEAPLTNPDCWICNDCGSTKLRKINQ